MAAAEKERTSERGAFKVTDSNLAEHSEREVVVVASVVEEKLKLSGAVRFA